jgi:YspA, cpYpsA-related SLOG family
MIVLICGGRNYDDVDRLNAVLDELHARHGLTVVIHGGARGADTLAGRWAASQKIHTSVYFADWERYGSKAGPRRNRQMLEEGKPDLVVAFPGGAVTAHMVRIAKAAGCQVLEVQP